MTKDTSGIDKAREVVDKLKAEKAAEKVVKVVKKEPMVEETTKAVATVEVNGIQVASEVAEFYKKNLTLGADNLSVESLPALKVVESNSKGELANGTRPNIGYFYFTKTKEQFETVDIAVMSISRGYYVENLDTEKKPKFQQILSGMILENMEPFIMYISGARCGNFFEFMKSMSAETKLTMVPMMALRITLGTTEYTHPKGEAHYIDFKIARDAENRLELLTDIGALEAIKSGIDSIERGVEAMITATAIDKNTGELLRDKVEVQYADTVIEAFDTEPEPEMPKGSDIIDRSGADIADDVPF